jgi:parvulin-like peptidyl-prolyl isomerase
VQETADSAPSVVPAGYETLATVNGVPINQTDVRRESSAHDKAPSPLTDQTKSALESLIGQELAAQKALELGLDKDRKYREELYRLEAQVAAFKRKALSDLFYRGYLDKQVTVTPAEVRKYFDDHADEFRTELKVAQILTRDESRIQAAHQSLQSGKSFDDVARELFPNVPPGSGTPWELPYLKWNQLPPAWRGVVQKLQEGQTSGIIRGNNQRFWIVKLLDKRTSEVPFESVEKAIAGMLRSDKLAALRKSTDEELRKSARIQYPAPSGQAGVARDAEAGP